MRFFLWTRNKGADQLLCNCEADQHICFRYRDSAIHLLPKFEISTLYSLNAKFLCPSILLRLYSSVSGRPVKKNPEDMFIHISRLIQFIAMHTDF